MMSTDSWGMTCSRGLCICITQGITSMWLVLLEELKTTTWASEHCWGRRGWVHTIYWGGFPNPYSLLNHWLHIFYWGKRGWGYTFWGGFPISSSNHSLLVMVFKMPWKFLYKKCWGLLQTPVTPIYIQQHGQWQQYSPLVSNDNWGLTCNRGVCIYSTQEPLQSGQFCEKELAILVNHT